MAERPNTADRPEVDLARVDEFLYWIEPDATLGGCTLQVRHPEFGWLNFPLTTRAAEELASQLKRYGGTASQGGRSDPGDPTQRHPASRPPGSLTDQ